MDSNRGSQCIRVVYDHFQFLTPEGPCTFRPGCQANLEISASLPSELQRRETYFILTSPCRRQTTGELCDVRILGSQVAETGVPSYGVQRYRWDVSTRSGTGRNTIGCLVQDALGFKKAVQDEVEYGILGNLLADSQEASREQAAFIQAKLPLLQVHVYCAPCVCLLHSAIELCKSLESPFVKAQFRPDSRLTASCCSIVDRSEGMRKLSEWVRDAEAEATGHESSIIATYLDMVWLDQRLEHLDYEQPYNFQDRSGIKRWYLILGEADHTSHLVQQAAGRIPRATDIWHFKPNFSGVSTRTLAGRFVEHRPRPLATRGTQLGSLSTPGPMPFPATPFAQPTSRKRPASPPSSTSASRRPRSDVESASAGTEPEEGESIAQSVAEDMEI